MQTVLTRLRNTSGPVLAVLLFGTAFVLGLAIFALSHSILVSATTMALASLSSALAMREILLKRDAADARDTVSLDLRHHTRQISALTDRIIELEADRHMARPDRAFHDHARLDQITRDIDDISNIVGQLIPILDSHEMRLAALKQRETRDVRPVSRTVDPPVSPPRLTTKPFNPLANLQIEGILRDEILGGKLKIRLLDVMHLTSERVTMRDMSCTLEGRLPEFRNGADLVARGISPGVIQLFDRVRFGFAYEMAGQIAAQGGSVPILCPIMSATFSNHQAADEIVGVIERQPESARRLILVLEQALIDTMTPDEQDRLLRLRDTGARLAMQVTRDFAFDPDDIARLGFGFIIAEAAWLLGDQTQALKSEIHPADLASYLDRYNIMLIAQNVSDPQHLKKLRALGIACAVGTATMRTGTAAPVFRDDIPDTPPIAASIQTVAPLRERLRRVQA